MYISLTHGRQLEGEIFTQGGFSKILPKYQRNVSVVLCNIKVNVELFYSAPES